MIVESSLLDLARKIPRTRKLFHGNCLDGMAQLDDNSIDSCCTDPPYGLSFMGANWDHGVPGVPFWKQVHRVLLPGAYLAAFCGSRTMHRMELAIEDAGLEICDRAFWSYASGFPKGRNIGLAIDSELGVDSKMVSEIPRGWSGASNLHASVTKGGFGYATDVKREYTAASDLGKAWGGWNTQLKPCFEPIVIARKRIVDAPMPGEYASGAPYDRGDASRLWFSGKANVADRVGSKHLTVKPVALMRWLTWLMTPPGGTVLDPFAGSGSTGVGADKEGFGFVLCEMDAGYVKDIERRTRTKAKVVG